jgi:hypothetical protein
VSGDLTIPDKIIHSGDTNTTIRFPAADTISMETAGSERLRIDSSGRVLIGLTASQTTDSNAHSKLQIATSAGPNIGLGNNSTDINDDGRLGIINFNSNHGGTYHEVATIASRADADHASNSKPSRLEFYTTQTGNTQGTERLRIDSSGRMILGTTGTIGNSYSDNFTISEASGNVGMQFAGNNSTSNYASIYFGDAGHRQRHFIETQLGTNGNFTIGTIGTGPIRFTNSGGEKLRIGSSGQIGVAGANYGESRQTIVSGGASAAVSWSSNPFLLDMAGLGDIDYDGVFLRYRETGSITGNGLVHLGLCKSTTNCSPGRIGIPVGFIPGTTYNSHFRVDKVGITPWPDGSGHRYEFYAIISDWVSAGKLGIFYLTNSTN